MGILTHVSDVIIPLIIFFVVGYGMVSGIKVYETFLKGAKDGLKVVVEIVPTLVGLMVAVGILRASGFFDLLWPARKNTWTVHGACGTAGAAYPPFDYQDVFLFGGNRTGA